VNASGTQPFDLSAGPTGALRAQGALTFANARRARQLGRAALGGPAPGVAELDCAGISAADSAGLAVLIDWLGYARQTQRALRYCALPPGIMALARISEVEELLTRGV
jgi:phospholipid transport system transporter-binding protein